MIVLDSCSWKGVQPQILYAIIRADQLVRATGMLQNITITSLSDGIHKAGSLHPKGLACDISVRDLPMDAEKFRADLARALGPEFDVLHEVPSAKHPEVTAEHIHVEYDPA